MRKPSVKWYKFDAVYRLRYGNGRFQMDLAEISRQEGAFIKTGPYLVTYILDNEVLPPGSESPTTFIFVASNEFSKLKDAKAMAERTVRSQLTTLLKIFPNE